MFNQPNLNLMKHPILLVRHAHHQFDQLTKVGHAECKLLAIKILGLCRDKEYKIVIIYDDSYARTKETAELVFNELQGQANVVLVSSTDSIEKVFLMHFTVDEFLEKVSSESNSMPVLGVVIGSCSDIPFALERLGVTDKEYRPSEVEEILGNTNFFNLDELSKTKRTLTLNELRAFVH